MNSTVESDMLRWSHFNGKLHWKRVLYLIILKAQQNADLENGQIHNIGWLRSPFLRIYGEIYYCQSGSVVYSVDSYIHITYSSFTYKLFVVVWTRFWGNIILTGGYALKPYVNLILPISPAIILFSENAVNIDFLWLKVLRWVNLLQARSLNVS